MSDRIGWRCRRGLLELDLWLGGFWAAHRDTLHPDEAVALERLLILADMEIMDLLQARQAVADASLETLVQRLKHYRSASLLETQ
ncbi:MAG: succinate dehydrogenase assembly factor 2 [Hydrogenophilales bacterium 17-61-9]|nr:MAG: succinate dehydrogenase assembly factor 2 [Hydrogenophilales bacterium 17-61-9]